MSEFSVTYHMRTKNIKEVEEMILKSGLDGVIIEKNNLWLSFAISEEPENIHLPNDKIVENSSGTLIFNVFAEDHGWALYIYEDGKQISKYEQDFDAAYSFERYVYLREYNMNALSKIMTGVSKLYLPVIMQISSLLPLGYNMKLSKKVASALNLPAYEWVLYEGDIKKIKEVYKDAYKVK
ncbi:MAG: hypothetical protein N4A47_00365 [Clostridia bacterium]|nr:hypothetical protein [Clostridia bacterium]